MQLDAGASPPQHTSPTTQRKSINDWQGCQFECPAIDLLFEIIDETRVKVTSVLEVTRREGVDSSVPLVLDAHPDLNIQSMFIVGGVEVGRFVDVQNSRDGEKIIVNTDENHFFVKTETMIDTSATDDAGGLYKSGKIFVTQCETEDFRRITPALDRPDVLSKFKTRIRIPKNLIEEVMLLSNGNAKPRKEVDGMIEMEFDLGVPIPTYLFALVAGKLKRKERKFVTKFSKKPVSLQIYVEEGYEDQTDLAFDFLEAALRYDEDVFGREYDLNEYKIVGISQLNFGAMENKGLNIFRTDNIALDPRKATFPQIIRASNVISHEEFHNLTGNRVSVKNWFNTSLKEALTVYRDQDFMASYWGENYIRIRRWSNDISTRLFKSDTGDSAQFPIRRTEYNTIEDLYDGPRVYVKGPEVMRMFETLFGRKRFIAIINVFLDEFDGKAASLDDFFDCVARQAPEALAEGGYQQMLEWFDKPGTPICNIKTVYSEENGIFEVQVNQDKESYFPLKMGLLDPETSEDMILELLDDDGLPHDLKRGVIHINKPVQTLRFKVTSKPILSMNRDLATAIPIHTDHTIEELRTLMTMDNNELVRYDASQKIYVQAFDQLMQQAESGQELSVNEDVMIAIGDLIGSEVKDPYVLSKMLSLPSLDTIVLGREVYDYAAAAKAKRYFSQLIVQRYGVQLADLYSNYHDSDCLVCDSNSLGRNSLKSICLGYLSADENSQYKQVIINQFENSQNMTDIQVSLDLLLSMDDVDIDLIIKSYRAKFEGDKMALDKLFYFVACSTRSDSFDILKEFIEGKGIFDIKTISHVDYALSFGLCCNYEVYHTSSGTYQYVTDKILEINNSGKGNDIASISLAKYAFCDLAKLGGDKQTEMLQEMNRILNGDTSDSLKNKIQDLIGAVS